MVFRFYIRCTRCNAEFTFKTDPKNSDYTAEHNCQRNFEPWRAKEATENALNQEKDEANHPTLPISRAQRCQNSKMLTVLLGSLQEEANDAMKKLENVTKDSKREMDILDALDEVRMLNARNNDITTDQMLNDLRERAAKQQEQEEVKTTDADEEEVKNAFAAKAGSLKRLADDEEDQGSAGPSFATDTAKPTSVWGQNLQKQIAAKREAQEIQQESKKKKVGARFAPLKRKVGDEAEQAAAKPPPVAASKGDGGSDGDSSGSGGGGGLGLLAGYGSSGSGSDGGE